jgi:hypothetical protein
MDDFLIKKRTESQVIYISFCFFINQFKLVVFSIGENSEIHYFENLINFLKPPNFRFKPRSSF